MGFNSAFKGLNQKIIFIQLGMCVILLVLDCILLKIIQEGWPKHGSWAARNSATYLVRLA